MSEASYAKCQAKLSFHYKQEKLLIYMAKSTVILSYLHELLGNSFIVLRKNKLFKLH